MNESNKLDSIDLKILKLLQENSKITNLELSKNIGLSPAPTLERVKKLELTGVIESYHAKVNTQKIGLDVRTFILVTLDWKRENALESFVDKIKEIDEITEAYIITGDGDFLIKVVCKDLQVYEQILFKKLSKITEVERIKSFVTLSKVKKTKLLPYDYDGDLE